MIPEFYDGMYLPPGDHPATWPEVVEKFGGGAIRSDFCRRLLRLLQAAKNCNFREVYLFGSFISAKELPGDVDLMWVYDVGLDFDSLRTECRELLNYQIMKEREKWDLWCCSDDQDVKTELLKGWRTDKSPEKKPRGLVILDIGVL